MLAVCMSVMSSEGTWSVCATTKKALSLKDQGKNIRLWLGHLFT
jgi:hypothetical protein